jgi:IS5 family transposase
MIKYTSTKQLSIEEFKTPFYFGLDKNNRWARLANQIPWDEFAKIYAKALCEDFGRPALDARIVIGALIIKHKKGLSDEETIEEIKENPYLQFFIGYEEFSHKPPFDPSLFVTLRERLGIDAFEQLNQAFIEGVRQAEDLKETKKAKSKGNDNPDSGDTPTEESKRQGALILDASVAPQDIKFPTDLDLLNDAREHTERIIDELWRPELGKRKPRTYRNIARKDYLSVAKQKKKSVKILRATIRKQLGYNRRNIKTIKKMLGSELGKQVPLSKRDLRIFCIVQEICRQQKEMYDLKVHSVSDRIVSIAQPYVRPIVRGKSKNQTEFGAKISASLVKGNVYLDHLSWDAFNEGTDLISQVEGYKDRFGFYPAAVIIDTIYGTRENRRYLKKLGIEFSGKALGRPPKLTEEEAKQAQIKRKAHAGLRNGIEGKFGEGKRKYDLDLVKAKTMRTSESWIAAVFFVMNLARWQRMCSLLSLFRWLKYFKERWSFRPVPLFLY